ncbi:MAG: hypothetical protein ABR588_02665 [Sphingomicrobium sp.]|nr:hypothetical protein [Sphingomonadales bacterium]
MSEVNYPGDETPRLTVRQAFDAVHQFLEAYWERGLRSSDDIRHLLSAMDGSMTEDGAPIDRAQWSDWLEAVAKVEASGRAKQC